MRVFVTGGTGYVGRTTINRLLGDGHEVVVLQRQDSPRPLADDRVTVLTGDLFDTATLQSAMSLCDAVVHLVGVIREFPGRGITMTRMHVDATRSVVQAATQAGIRRFVQMSALGARPEAVSNYHRTKWMAEESVRKSGLVYTILRPSVIFGKGGPGPQFIGQLADLVRAVPVVPVIGHGQFKLQPVSIKTVAATISKSLASRVADDRTFELGGPEVVTYVEVLHRIARVMGKPLRTVGVPVAVMTALVPWLSRIPQFPITPDQLTMLLEGNVCGDSQTVYRDLELTPVPFSIDLSDL